MDLKLDKDLLKKAKFAWDLDDDDTIDDAFADVTLTVLKLLIFAFKDNKSQTVVSKFNPLFCGLFPKLVKKWDQGEANVPMVKAAVDTLVQMGYVQEESVTGKKYKLHIIDEKYSSDIEKLIDTDSIPEAQDDAIFSLIESAWEQKKADSKGKGSVQDAKSVVSKLFDRVKK